MATRRDCKLRLPTVWWQHQRPVAVKGSQWTPLPWNQCTAATGRVDTHNVSKFTEVSTTIAAGSNGAVLPQAMINVVSTDGFPSAGYLVIEGPPGAGVDTVVKYTGKTATTFTGASQPYSTGTLATNQPVRSANVAWSAETVGYLWQAIAEIAMSSVPATNYYAVRFTQFAGGFPFVGASHHAPGVNIANQHLQVALQPGYEPGNTLMVEAFQSSAGVINSVVDGLQSPSLMQVCTSLF